MRKNQIPKIIVHVPDDIDIRALSNKVNEFHVDVIIRRLNSSNLSADDKIAIIDNILLNLKSREQNGVIK